MITPVNPALSFASPKPIDELRATYSLPKQLESAPSVIQRETSSAVLPVQVVSVSTIGEEVAPAEETDSIESSRIARAQTETEASTGEVDPSEAAMIRELAQRDREVRQHEMAHKSAAGSAAGAVSYDYQRGPDGRLYAVGGEVDIRLAPPSNDPREVQRYAEQILRAALAPAEPSGQDRQVAAQARAMLADAQAEISRTQSSESTQAVDTDTEESAETDSVDTRTAEEEAERSTPQAEIERDLERSAEALAEFQRQMNEVNQRFAEINQRLAELGVLENIYQPGGVFSESV